MIRSLAVGLVIASIVTTGACKQRSDGKRQLPPATGSGAAPLPKLTVPDPVGTGSSDPPTPTQGHATGTLFPRAEAQLAPNASGIISQVLVEESARVKKGQVVVQLDPRDAALRLEQARAALQAARINLKGVEVEYERTKALFEQNAIQRAVWEQVQTRRDGAKVGVQQADVMVAMAGKALADTTLRSPIDGVVTAKLKNVGEMATMMPPTIVLVIQDQAMLELRFRLAERELSEVKLGQAVRAHVGALGLDRVATIGRITPTIDARTRTFEVVAMVDNADQALRAGLLVEVDYRGTPPAPPSPGSAAGSAAPKEHGSQP